MTNSPNNMSARTFDNTSFPNFLVTINVFNTFHNHVIDQTFVITPFLDHVFCKTVFITSVSELWGCSLLESTLLLFHPITPSPPTLHTVTDEYKDL